MRVSSFPCLSTLSFKLSNTCSLYYSNSLVTSLWQPLPHELSLQSHPHSFSSCVRTISEHPTSHIHHSKCHLLLLIPHLSHMLSLLSPYHPNTLLYSSFPKSIFATAVLLSKFLLHVTVGRIYYLL